MTRINCIPPECLLDQHLLAEYNETAMALASLRRSKASSKPLPQRDTYTLNAGHVIFFYDKGAFLKRRYESLKVELLKRNYDLDPNRKMEWEVYDNVYLMKDWKPSIVDQKTNVARILERMNAKPDWYKYNRKPIKIDEWREKYSKWVFKEV
jgi:deoxyribonuclease (pyrimidine dimer)